jgi:hypothetical protein
LISSRAGITTHDIEKAPIGPNQEDYDVLADGAGVSRIFLSLVAPQDRQWMRTAMTRRVRPRWRRSQELAAGVRRF